MKAAGSRNPARGAVLGPLCHLRVPKLWENAKKRCKYRSVSLSCSSQPYSKGGGRCSCSHPLHIKSTGNAFLSGVRLGLRNCTGLLPLRRAGNGKPRDSCGARTLHCCPLGLHPRHALIACPAPWPAPCPHFQLPPCKHMSLPLTHYQVTLRLLTPTTGHVTQDAPGPEELCGAAVTGAPQGGPLLGAGAQRSGGSSPWLWPRRTGSSHLFPSPCLHSNSKCTPHR